MGCIEAAQNRHNVGGLDSKMLASHGSFVYTESRQGLVKPPIGQELPAVDADKLGASCRELGGGWNGNGVGIKN